jgi:hypothetical protein
MTIFSAQEDNEIVLCCPPVSQSNCGISGKRLRNNLLTKDDLANFVIKDQQVDLF